MKCTKQWKQLHNNKHTPTHVQTCILCDSDLLELFLLLEELLFCLRCFQLRGLQVLLLRFQGSLKLSQQIESKYTEYTSKNKRCWDYEVEIHWTYSVSMYQYQLKTSWVSMKISHKLASYPTISSCQNLQIISSQCISCHVVSCQDVAMWLCSHFFTYFATICDIFYVNMDFKLYSIHVHMMSIWCPYDVHMMSMSCREVHLGVLFCLQRCEGLIAVAQLLGAFQGLLQALPAREWERDCINSNIYIYIII